MLSQTPAAEVDSPFPEISTAGGEPALAEAEDGRPTTELPLFQLVRLSAYWFGLTCVFAGITPLLSGRIKFEHLAPPEHVGGALFQVSVWGTLIAMLVQPTVGTISDYTTSHWGRRKPYILLGSVLDLIFLLGIASSNTLLAIAAFVVLLQFSSNVAQGPFQGYVPDLVPTQQVGLASALMGLFMSFGNVAGYAIGALAVATDQFFLATMALGAVEFITMLSVVIHVDEGRAPKCRAGRSWARIAVEAWGTDILRERSFLYLLASRLCVLTGGGVLFALAVFYLADTLKLSQRATGETELAVLAIGVVTTALAVIPAARLSDRIGRKPVIYVSCFLGAISLAVFAVAPSVPVAAVGAVFYGVGNGTFLAVDWALMTEIIPKASSGRYMGISNVATASATILPTAIGGALIMDNVNQLFGLGTGARAAMLFGVACCILGAVLLTRVEERRREELPPATDRPPTIPTPLTA